MSSEDKVIQFHISRLRDKNPDVLLKTIQELVQFGAKAEPALPTLKDIFENTDNLDVKKAAQQAGRAIFAQVKSERGDDS